nr:energy-coupling factor transporter ATPase [Clostridiales bacterium]
TVILVSHSMEDVAALATSVILMHRSSVVMQGTVEEVFTQGGLLKSMGLNVPQVTEIFEGLRARGLPVSDRIFTIEQGLDELLRFYGKEAVR